MREPAEPSGAAGVDTTITCIDCGGTAHLLTTWPADDPPQPGDVLTYRCADCWDRWDLVIPESPEAGGEPGSRRSLEGP